MRLLHILWCIEIDAFSLFSFKLFEKDNGYMIRHTLLTNKGNTKQKEKIIMSSKS